MYVGITAAGVFRTDDAGETWTPRNRSVVADFLGRSLRGGRAVPAQAAACIPPGRTGSGSRTTSACTCSDDRGDSWARVDENGLPSSFGFPLMLDPADPDAAFVIPEESLEYHYSPGRAACRLRDAGRAGRRGSR